MGNFSRTKLQSTISVTRLVDSHYMNKVRLSILPNFNNFLQNVTSFDLLLGTLEVAKSHFSDTHGKDSVGAQVSDLSQKIKTLIQENEKVS